jgi:hypothetical protein
MSIEIQISFGVEIAQFLDGVIIAESLFLTHCLASLGDIACCGTFMGIFRFLLCRARVQLRDSAPFLPQAWLLGPKPFSRLVSFALGNHCARRLDVLVSESFCVQELRQKMNKLTQSLPRI